MMRVMLKAGVMVVVAEDADDAGLVDAFLAGHAGHCLRLERSGALGAVLSDLGPMAEACREPINVHSRMPQRELSVIGNFAPSPFELHGEGYASVEGFWQGLRCEDAAERRRIGALSGGNAKRAGDAVPYGAAVSYRGERILVGRAEHWALMWQACAAKFRQNEVARAALLSTGRRPLVHRARRDSRTIPGVVLAEIWMGVRARLRDPAGGLEGHQLPVPCFASTP